MLEINFEFVIKGVKTNNHMDGYIFIAIAGPGPTSDVEVD